jgi:hypothetical protein
MCSSEVFPGHKRKGAGGWKKGATSVGKKQAAALLRGRGEKISISFCGYLQKSSCRKARPTGIGSTAGQNSPLRPSKDGRGLFSE